MSDQNDFLLFPLEIIVFCGLAFGIYKLKKRFPNLLFPCQGVTIFLPPDNEDLKENKDKKTKTLTQIRSTHALAEHFTQAPFANEMEITILFLYVLFSQFVLTEVMKMILNLFGFNALESGMLFYFDGIIVLMIIRNIYKAATIGGSDSQQTKMSITICIITVALTVLVNIGFKDFLNINIKHEFQRQAVHFEIVLRTLVKPGIWSFMGQFGDIFVIVLSIGEAFIIFCIIPILIRFGNCFTELKNKMNTENAEKKFFYLLAGQLVTHLIFLSLYIKPITLNLNYVFHFQFIALLCLIILQILTYINEMNKHMAKACDWILILKEQPEQQDYVKRRSEGLLRGFVIVSYQLLSKIAIPMLLFMILLLKNQQVPDTTIRYNYMPSNYEINEMYCIKNNTNILEYLYQPTQQIIEDDIDPSKIIMKRVSKYGLLTKSFVYTLIEFILFNYYLISFVLSIFYIFFLNKTQAIKQPIKTKKKQQ